MPRAHAFTLDDPALAPPESLEACDEAGLPADLSQQASALLGQFAMLMADHGREVETELMRGDRGYALWQLARAHSMDDPVLRQLAMRLFGVVERG